MLQVTSYYAPAWGYGGPPRVMSSFARGLAARGHDVTVMTTDVLDADHRARPRAEILDGVRVERHPNLSNSLAWRTKKYLPPGLVSAVLRRAHDFDVVHATDARTVATAAAYLASRRAAVPFCLSAHGSLPGSTGPRGVLKRGYDRLLVRPMLAEAALLLAQTDHEARLYAEAGGRPSAVHGLPLPLEQPARHNRSTPGYLRNLIRGDDAIPLVLFLGRIHPLKGVALLVGALEPLLRSGVARLVIVGRDDGGWAAIADRYSDLVSLGTLHALPPIYGSERFDAYADADVFALTPTHWEETSLASLEAASCGTALLLTEQADVPGLAASGGGAVVRADPSAIREALLDLLPRSYEAGMRARELVLAQHSAEVVVSELERLLTAVVDARGRR